LTYQFLLSRVVIFCLLIFFSACPAGKKVERDIDGDGIPDSSDNCPTVYNPDQKDSDGNGTGDECEMLQDIDGDGIADEDDNCPFVANYQQKDFDEDGVGDECDNCPSDPNPEQEDTDGDGVGDICDNCPAAWDPFTVDSDGDGRGDACDLCPFLATAIDVDGDGDGTADACDNCPYVPNPDQKDSDFDGWGDTCDVCPLVYDPRQWSIACARDFDYDGDGVDNLMDNCPFIYNPAQENLADQEAGDACFLLSITEVRQISIPRQVFFKGRIGTPQGRQTVANHSRYSFWVFPEPPAEGSGLLVTFEGNEQLFLPGDEVVVSGRAIQRENVTYEIEASWMAKTGNTRRVLPSANSMKLEQISSSDSSLLGRVVRLTDVQPLETPTKERSFLVWQGERKLLIGNLFAKMFDYPEKISKFSSITGVLHKEGEEMLLYPRWCEDIMVEDVMGEGVPACQCPLERLSISHLTDPQKQPRIYPGCRVDFNNLLVTATASNFIYFQDSSLVAYGAALVDMSQRNYSGGALSVGDLVGCRGLFTISWGRRAILAENCTSIGSAEQPAVLNVSWEELTAGGESFSAHQGMLVKVTDVVIVNERIATSPVDDGTFVVSPVGQSQHTLYIGWRFRHKFCCPRLWALAGECPANGDRRKIGLEFSSITGILDLTRGEPTLEPRHCGDLLESAGEPACPAL